MGYCIYLRKGETHTTPSTGILASDLAVGDIVKLTESGTPVEYIVVNQGIPGNSSLYDSSCDGTWLLRKDCHSSRIWDSDDYNAYASSDIKVWLNGDFFNSFGNVEKSIIKQIKIPYRVLGVDGQFRTGANGLSCVVFLLSGYEVGLGGASYVSEDGAKLDYFNLNTGADSKRIAYLNGAATIWWLRTPYSDNKTNALRITLNGNYNSQSTSYSHGIRPALILPSTAKFDSTTLILKG